MADPSGERPTSTWALSPNQVRLLAGLFALLALVSLVRWWAAGGGHGEPSLTEAPKDLDYPPDTFRAAHEAKAP